MGGVARQRERERERGGGGSGRGGVGGWETDGRTDGRTERDGGRGRDREGGGGGPECGPGARGMGKRARRKEGSEREGG